MDIRITATCAAEALEEVAKFYDREAGRLNVNAGRTVGRQRKDCEAQALYAGRQAIFWRSVKIED